MEPFHDLFEYEQERLLHIPFSLFRDITENMVLLCTYFIWNDTTRILKANKFCWSFAQQNALIGNKIGSSSCHETPSTHVCWMRLLKAMITKGIQPMGSKTFDESERSVRFVICSISWSIEKRVGNGIPTNAWCPDLVIFRKQWSCSRFYAMQMDVVISIQDQ